MEKEKTSTTKGGGTAKLELEARQKKSKRYTVFIPAIGTLGDVLPFAALAERLAKEGVRVLFAAHRRHVSQIKQDLGTYIYIYNILNL